MLEDVYASYRKLADEITWKKYDQNDLFFNYLKYKDLDPHLAEKFYAAIICRYWGYTGRLYLKMNKNITFEECYDILIDTINYLLEKQVWNSPTNVLYKDPKGPEKAFHFVLKRQTSVMMSKKTADKRKSNFKTLSIDEIHDDYNDAAEGLFSLITSEDKTDLSEYINYQTGALNKIILDKICYSNWKSLNSVASKVKDLSDEDYEYFHNKYKINKSEFDVAKATVGAKSRPEVLTDIKKLLYNISKDWR